MIPILTRWPPAVRFLACQLLSLGALLLLGRLAGIGLPGWGWVALQGLASASLGKLVRLPNAWILVNLGTPALLDVLVRLTLPTWTAPLILLGLALVFGGGVLTRVPLYHSNRDAWNRLQELLPEAPGPRFLDLGAGFGGPLSRLAKVRPDGHFLGVEASPLNWAVASFRCLPRPNVQVRLGSLWRVPLHDYDVVFAFLSPIPMGELWAKVQREMRPGTRFVSHTFEVPGVKPDLEIPLAGRRDAVLRVYQIL